MLQMMTLSAGRLAATPPPSAQAAKSNLALGPTIGVDSESKQSCSTRLSIEIRDRRREYCGRDVEATPALTMMKWPPKTILDRPERRFDRKPTRFAADTPYGTGKFVSWLVRKRRSFPCILVVGIDQSPAQMDFAVRKPRLWGLHQFASIAQ